MEHEKQTVVNVIQGDFHITQNEDVILTTILGSCVAVCLFDATQGVGGMNHFLLPSSRTDNDTDNLRYGTNAMELLINGLLKRGATRENLEAKVFGGAMLTGPGRNIGKGNAAFARQFLADEAIPVAGESLGGTHPRRIRFWPTTGLVRQLLVSKEISEPTPPAPVVPVHSDANITLF